MRSDYNPLFENLTLDQLTYAPPASKWDVWKAITHQVSSESPTTRYRIRICDYIHGPTCACNGKCECPPPDQNLKHRRRHTHICVIVPGPASVPVLELLKSDLPMKTALCKAILIGADIQSMRRTRP